MGNDGKKLDIGPFSILRSDSHNVFMRETLTIPGSQVRKLNGDAERGRALPRV